MNELDNFFKKQIIKEIKKKEDIINKTITELFHANLPQIQSRFKNRLDQLENEIIITKKYQQEIHKILKKRWTRKK